MIIGYNNRRKPVIVDPQILAEHMLITAGSGAGKTNLLIFFIMQLAAAIYGMWIFDFRKREFSPIKSALKRKGIDLIVLSGDLLRFNMLQPPVGVSTNIWAVIISDLLCEAMVLPQRASKLLQTRIMKLYSAFGGHEQMEKQKSYPNLFDLSDSIKSDMKANYQASRAVIDNLEPLLIAHGDILACRYGWPVSELTDKHIVFELNGLLETAKNLVLGFVLISEFTRRIELGFSNVPLSLVAICDEAQRLISSAGSIGANVIKSQVGLIRGTGLGMLFSAQSSHDIIPEIISNTATKVMGRCGSFQDYNSMGKAMGQDHRQIKWSQKNLKAGKFVAQFAGSSFREPFVFTVPDMASSKDKNPQPADSTSLDYLQAISMQTESEVQKDQAQGQSQHSEPAHLFETPQEYRLCKVIADSPMQPSSSYYKLAGISSKTAMKVRKSLAAKKYLKEHSLGTGTTGRSKILMEATAAGVEAIKAYERQGN